MHSLQENSGKIIAESVTEGWTSLRGKQLNDPCLPNNSSSVIYFQVQKVNDVNQDDLHPCYAEMLRENEVRSNLAIPIFQDNEIWGFLIAQQCAYTRQWKEEEINFLKKLSQQVAIAVQQAQLYEQTQIELLKREQLATQLRHEAMHDKLTQLPNRSLLMDRLQHVFQVYRREKQNTFRFALLFLDLNRFKVINDTLGHDAGDELLITVAERLQGCLREMDTISRLGGDEFVVIVEGINTEEDAVEVANRIHDALAPSIRLNGQEVYIGTSIGIVMDDSRYSYPEEMLRDADIAMYEAKRNHLKYAVFEPKMRDKIKSQLQLDQALQQAISNQELSVAYQPIVALPTNQVIGFECLLRWYNQEKENWISPHRFIQIAERTELIKEIGEWVLIQACQQLQAWQERFTNREITVSVNVSPKQLQDEMLVDQVKKAIESYQINPNCLRLEVTETAILEANAKSILEDLKAIGVKLYLDDFGIGESSLSRLYQLPLDVIKIDKAFVLGIPENRRKSAIVRTIITLADNLELDLIAEGVETEIQSQSLLEWGCQKGQGFLFSQPISASEATEMIRD
ncbi:UNVERIFIED_CONTAM: hypothetical protein BEN50_00985 [Euhalothece sp. KZN 001]